MSPVLIVMLSLMVLAGIVVGLFIISAGRINKQEDEMKFKQELSKKNKGEEN